MSKARTVKMMGMACPCTSTWIGRGTLGQEGEGAVPSGQGVTDNKGRRSEVSRRAHAEMVCTPCREGGAARHKQLMGRGIKIGGGLCGQPAGGGELQLQVESFAGLRGKVNGRVLRGRKGWRSGRKR